MGNPEANNILREMLVRNTKGGGERGMKFLRGFSFSYHLFDLFPTI